jgi:hypothetical protein
MLLDEINKFIKKKHFNMIINDNNSLNNDSINNDSLNNDPLNNNITINDMHEIKPPCQNMLLDEINKFIKKKHFNMIINDNDPLNNDLNNNINNNIVNFKINKLSSENTISKTIAPYLNPFTFNIVYQYQYKNKKVTGLGDFIRGIYFALQFSEKYNIRISIRINNHLIKKHLINFSNKPDMDEAVAFSIPFFDLENYKYVINNNTIDYEYINIDDDFSKFLLDLPDYNKNKYLYTINHPAQHLINNKHVEFVKKVLQPQPYIVKFVDKTLLKLKLEKKHFITIHIRTSDDCFDNNNSLDLGKNMNILLHFIRNAYIQHKLNILILSSDKNIKLIIAKHFPNIKIIINNITHTCLNNNEEGLLNTLKDFYMMSYSKYIYSFSVYNHGSGFSKWCATTYNIPYVCYSLEGK